MNIDRAIEVIGENGLESGEGTWEEYLEAILLGIEALKRIKAFDTYPKGGYRMPLPGETKD